MLRRAAWTLILLAILLAAPTAQAAQGRFSLALDGVASATRLVPDEEFRATIALGVEIEAPFYCNAPIKLRLALAEGPDYAEASLAPDEFTLRFDPAVHTNTWRTSFTSTLRIRVSMAAPALRADLYAFEVKAEAPASAPDCNVAFEDAEVSTTLVNDYVVNTTATIIGWERTDPKTFLIGVNPSSNGATRVTTTARQYDPFVWGRIEAKPLEVAAGATGIVRVQVGSVPIGYHVAHLDIVSRFDGPEEARTDTDQLRLEIGDPDAPAPQQARGTSPPWAGAGGALAVLAGAWIRRRQEAP